MSPALRWICPSLATLVCGWLVAQGALADNAMPIKTGLWQVSSQSELNGKKVADASERLAGLPPEARAKMQAMLKERGVALDDGGGIKICHTQQTLESGALRGEDMPAPCKTEFTSRTSKAWKWHSECTQPVASVTDGETVFDSPESYTITRNTTMQRGGQSQTMRAVIKAKWLGSDCGDVKPLQLQLPAAKKP